MRAITPSTPVSEAVGIRGRDDNARRQSGRVARRTARDAAPEADAPDVGARVAAGDFDHRLEAIAVVPEDSGTAPSAPSVKR